ncbi:DUF72 domain-containing protein [Candidatus Nitrosocosmicus hydrocola]|uniref:DUF72 domain-containing protein n=1 Tax=Candidatus Nitrosocosmicus hydrocola TaxID=1826872 RepID=UPI001372F93D|nr:DUF72 domain-containing protein [Candidatus Nitrosocosmicus hydrocola]
MNLYIGCSGWTYSGWNGAFYPNNLKNWQRLSYYSRFFNYIEVDSTFYYVPSRNVINGWKNKTPDDFKFSFKFPQVITHVNKLERVSKYIEYFFFVLEPLLEKTLMLLIQLPSFMSAKVGLESLKHFINKLDTRYRYALEVREASWFDFDIYDFLKQNDITLVWRVKTDLQTPTFVTSDTIYLRFIGDRVTDQTHFGLNIKDKEYELKDYVGHLKYAREHYNIKNVIVTFNNNYAGLGPQLANEFSRLLYKSMEERDV